MKNLKKIIYCFAFLAFGTTNILFAQQDAMFTHYMFNTLEVNAGYAGSRDALTVTGINRSQWVGFKGAPVTQTITLHSPIYREELGAGLSIVNDKIGPVNISSIYVDLAYRMKLGEVSKLSFGLKGGVNLLRAGLNDLNIIDNLDQSFQSDIQSKTLPNFGFGLYYSNPKFYVGFSTPRILQNNFKENTNENASIKDKRHYFLIGGAILRLSETVQLKPTTFVKATAGAPIEADLTAVLVFDNLFWAGGMYRTGDAIGGLAGINITRQIQVGYSFDWSYGLQTGRYNGGSHEIMLRYDFIYKDKEKIRSPRYF